MSLRACAIALLVAVCWLSFLTGMVLKGWLFQ